MNIIAAVDSNWAIGCQNDLLVRIPRDQQMFRRRTEGKVIVVGRKTLATFPQKQPLENRINIIMSKNKRYAVNGAVVMRSVKRLMRELEKYNSDDVYVVGGADVYRQLLPYCDAAYITKIGYIYHADAHFPNLDEMPEWELTQVSEEQTYFDITYYFLKYERKKDRGKETE